MSDPNSITTSTGTVWTFSDAKPDGLTISFLGSSRPYTLAELSVGGYPDVWPAAKTWWESQMDRAVEECWKCGAASPFAQKVESARDALRRVRDGDVERTVLKTEGGRAYSEVVPRAGKPSFPPVAKLDALAGRAERTVLANLAKASARCVTPSIPSVATTSSTSSSARDATGSFLPSKAVPAATTSIRMAASAQRERDHAFRQCFDVENWAKVERSRIDTAKAELDRLLRVLRASLIRGSAEDPAAIRRTLESFEEIELGISGDLAILCDFYGELPDDYGWGEASDEELVAAARKAFGGAA